VVERQQFIDATDFLKSNFGLTFGKIAESIGEKEQAVMNVRRGSKKVNAQIIGKLINTYPQIESFFATKVADDDVVNDAMILVSDGRAWKELAETQKKLLEAQEHRIVKQDEEIRDLKAEVRYLRERCMELEKKNG
jgi:predicted transcriptional regulator